MGVEWDTNIFPGIELTGTYSTTMSSTSFITCPTGTYSTTLSPAFSQGNIKIKHADTSMGFDNTEV